MRQMKKILWLTLLSLLLLSAGLACETENADKPAPLTVTEAKSDESLELQQGQQLIIRLPANPSTGYAWAQADPGNSLLKEDSPSAFEQDLSGGNPPPPGAGGTEVLTFSTGVTGQQTLRLDYLRPWETGVPPTKSVSYNVTVK